MKRMMILLLVVWSAVAAARADDLRGVVTFASGEFLVVAPERKPAYRGTLVKLVREDGERAFGSDRLQTGDILRIKGEWLDESLLTSTFQAALVEKTGRVDELPEPKLPKLSDYRKGWRALTRLRLEGVVKSLDAHGEGRSARTHLVLKSEDQRLAVCVWDTVDGEMFAPGAKVSVVGVPRTILGANGEAVADGRRYVPENIRELYNRRQMTGGLTLREIEVLARIRKGLKSEKIGEELGMTVDGVKQHVRHILAKLDVPDRAAAVSEAVRRGFLHG